MKRQVNGRSCGGAAAAEAAVVVAAALVEFAVVVVGDEEEGRSGSRLEVMSANIKEWMG